MRLHYVLNRLYNDALTKQRLIALPSNRLHHSMTEVRLTLFNYLTIQLFNYLTFQLFRCSRHFFMKWFNCQAKSHSPSHLISY